MADSEGNMAETITAGEASQYFSRIVPERSADGRRVLTAEQERLLAESLEWARNYQIPAEAEPLDRFDRDELYEERL